MGLEDYIGAVGLEYKGEKKEGLRLHRKEGSGTGSTGEEEERKA